jgi:alanyl-tRNA synthetase
VLDAQKQEGLVLHRAQLAGPLKVGEHVVAAVHPSHRLPVMKNHSATHLLHLALRETLGSHVEQRGSLVSPERLRFDFTHFEAISEEQLRKIEARVNELIQENHPIATAVTTPAEARAAGAMALFGEKYGEKVRMVGMGPSKELCGGTHCQQTGQIGYFRIASESSIAAGVRRIEALTGAAAVTDAQRADAALDALAVALKTKREDLTARVEALQEEIAALRRERESMQKKAANAAAGELLSQVKDVAGAKLLAASVEGADPAGLRTTLDGIRRNQPEGAVVLAGVKEGKVALLVSMSHDVVKRGGHAGNLLKQLAPLVGGKGGGKPEMAQGGGTETAKVPQALAAAAEILAKMMK